MKAIEIFTEFHQFVEQVDEYLDKVEKLRKNNSCMAQHKLNMAERDLKTCIAKFRICNSKPKAAKAFTRQGGFNFLAR